jgi:hypothetical protein
MQRGAGDGGKANYRLLGIARPPIALPDITNSCRLAKGTKLKLAQEYFSSLFVTDYCST